ncbi:MAG: zinc finger domain-containing protein [Microthrixaceae bacterium]
MSTVVRHVLVDVLELDSGQFSIHATGVPCPYCGASPGQRCHAVDGTVEFLPVSGHRAWNDEHEGRKRLAARIPSNLIR